MAEVASKTTALSSDAADQRELVFDKFRRSGYLAAEAVLRSSGAPQDFLQEDLAPDGLMKFWARAAIRNR